MRSHRADERLAERVAAAGELRQPGEYADAGSDKQAQRALRQLRNRHAALLAHQLRDLIPEVIEHLRAEQRAFGYQKAAQAILSVTAERLVERIKAGGPAHSVQTPATRSSGGPASSRAHRASCPTCGAALAPAQNAGATEGFIAPLDSTNAGEGL